MPAFQKWSSPQWATKLKSKSHFGEGNHPAPQRPASVENPPVAIPISLPAEVPALADHALVAEPVSPSAEVRAPAEDPLMERKRQRSIVFVQKVSKALGDREFKVAVEMLRMYMGGRKCIDEVYQSAAVALKDRSDLLAEFRSFLPSPTCGLPVVASTPPMSVPKGRRGKRSAATAFPEQSYLRRTGAAVAGDSVGGEQSSKRRAAAVVEENKAQEPVRRSTRISKARVMKDIGVDEGRKKSCVNDGGDGVAVKKGRQAQAELAEQEKRQEIQREEQQKRLANLAEQKRLAAYEAWWPKHLNPDYKPDREIEVGKPSRNGKFWYPWINQEPPAQVQVECLDATKHAASSPEDALASEKVALLDAIYLYFDMIYRPKRPEYRYRY